MSHNPLYQPVPGVGVCPHDLRFLALTVLRAFGSNTQSAATAADVMHGAINQSTFELEAIAESLGENHDLYYVVLAIKERLYAAAEVGTVIEKLLRTIPDQEAEVRQ